MMYMKEFRYLLFGRTWKGSLARVIVLLVILSAPFGYHYQPVYVDGISMEPTYDDGQWVLMQRKRSLGNDWAPDRFDVIIVWSDKHKEKLCKRVIGLPGEIVEVRDGKIYIDKRELSDSFGQGKLVYMALEDPNSDDVWWRVYDNIEPRIIATGEVWIIGDNREDSIFGHFPVSKIRGKVVLY